MLRRLFASALFFSAVLPGAPAWADPSATELSAARELFREAELDEQKGHFEAALQKMQRVGRVKMTPGVRVHIAFAEEKLGRWVAAFNDYSAAEREAEDAPQDKREELLRTIRGPLQKLRASVPQLQLAVDASQAPAGMRVWLDGTIVEPGLFNLAMRIDMGEHRVTATAPGYARFETSLVAAEGSSHRVDVTLAKVADHSPPPAQAATAAAPRNHVSPWFAAGGAVLALGGGITSFVIAGNVADSERARCAGLLTCDPDRSTVRVLDSVAVGGFIGGAALATLAVYLWTRPEPNKPGVAVTAFGAAGRF